MTLNGSALPLNAPMNGVLPIFDVNVADNPINNREATKMARQRLGRCSNQIYLYGIRAELFVPSNTDTIDVCQIPNVSVSFLLGFVYPAPLIIHI